MVAMSKSMRCSLVLMFCLCESETRLMRSSASGSAASCTFGWAAFDSQRKSETPVHFVAALAPEDDHGPKKLTAPMPGKVVRILVSEGAEIEAGAGILVVEAMKMQNEVKSPKKGIVQKITVREGAAVNSGDVLAIVE